MLNPSSAPSKVVYIRNLPHDSSTQELAAVFSRFGRVTNIIYVREKRHALVQFSSAHEAVSLVNIASGTQLAIRESPIYISLSKHTELQSGEIGPDNSSLNEVKNQILIVTIFNPPVLVTVDILYQIFASYGPIEKISIFNNMTLEKVQALVQFARIENAVSAKTALQGQNVFGRHLLGTNSYMVIGYSRLTQVVVPPDPNRGRDYTLVTTNPANPTQQPLLVPATSSSSSSSSAPAYPIAAQPPPHPLPHPHDMYMSGGAMAPQPSQPQYMHPMQSGALVHPQFAPASVSVLLVSNLSQESITCDRLFNLFSSFGIVNKVKILNKKPDHALIQFQLYPQASVAARALNGVDLFGKKMHVSFSKHPQIAGTSSADGHTKEYSAADNRKVQPSRGYASQPTNVLHISNLPESNRLQEVLTRLFTEHGTVVDVKLYQHNQKNMSLVQMHDIHQASQSVACLHNTPVSALLTMLGQPIHHDDVSSGKIKKISVSFSMNSISHVSTDNNNSNNNNGSSNGISQ